MRPIALAAFIAVAGLASTADADSAPLDGTWQGELPCADCAGIHHRLQLTPDGNYLLDLTYRQPKGGADQAVHEVGRWRRLPDGRLELASGPDRRYFAPQSDGRLRPLDIQGKPISSRLYRPLVRDAKPEAVQTGIFVYFADAGLFTRCSDGSRVPVAQQGASLDLERAYTRQRSQPAAPLAVSLVGHFETRPGPDGGSAEMLVVDRFDRALPGQGCPDTPAQRSMRWTLESLPGSAAAIPASPRTPWIQFDADQRRLTGTTGCNRMSGEYRSWGGTGLSILPLATTRMACPAMAVESAFLQALARTTHVIQAADRLELLADGVPVARFVAH